MKFELNISIDEKFISLNIIDSLIIFKLIEEFTNLKLSNERRFYNNIRDIEYLSYDDLWWPVDSFLYHTEIGEMTYDGEQFELTLYALSEAHNKKLSLEPELRIEIDALTEELSEQIFNVDDGACFIIRTSFNPEKLIVEGFVSFDSEGSICWHSICEILLDTHKKCQKYL